MFCCSSADKAREVVADEETTERMAMFFKAFSEPIRIKILLSMLHGEICVKDLAELLEISQPRVSNQLKLLKQCNLVKSRKEKNSVFYSLDDGHIADILNVGLNHINHTNHKES